MTNHIHIGPMQFLHDSSTQVLVGSLARLIRRRNPSLTVETARDIAISAVCGALAHREPQGDSHE